MVLRDAGGHITTIREIEERKKAVEKAVRYPYPYLDLI